MDVRIHAQLIKRIDSYSGSVRDLGNLIADLDAVWDTETWDEASRDKFRGVWGRLEEVYATVVERRPPSMTVVDEGRIREALAEVCSLLPPLTSEE